jgi:TRAP-type C4-dicarboxylate transport system permease small subunit
MKLVQLIQFLRKHLKTVTRICFTVLALLVILDAIPGVIDKEHAHTSAEHWPAFWSVFGFIACVLIIIVSKAFGHAGIMQREDYYDR